MTSDRFTSRIWKSPRSIVPGLLSHCPVRRWIGPRSSAAPSSPNNPTKEGITPKSGLYMNVQITPAAASEMVIGRMNAVR